jgi:hypothetical protein
MHWSFLWATREEAVAVDAVLNQKMQLWELLMFFLHYPTSMFGAGMGFYLVSLEGHCWPIGLPFDRMPSFQSDLVATNNMNGIFRKTDLKPK